MEDVDIFRPPRKDREEQKEDFMGDSMKAVHETMKDYERLCRYFGEDVRYRRSKQGGLVEDIHGPHHNELEKKYEEEQKANVQRCPHCKEKIN